MVVMNENCLGDGNDNSFGDGEDKSLSDGGADIWKLVTFNAGKSPTA